MEKFFYKSANFRDAGGSADQDDFVNLFGLEASIFESLLAGADGAVDDGLDELFELFARDLAEIMLAAGKFDIELCRGLRGERDLGFDDGFANGLHGFGVAAQVVISKIVISKIETEVAANVVERDGDQQIVDVIAAEMGVAIGSDDFENAVVQLENGNVESAAAEIVDGDDSVLLFVEAVGERCGGGFVDQAQDFEAGDAACIFGSLALGVVEIGGHGDNGFRYRGCEKALGVALELTENQGGDCRRGESLLAELLFAKSDAKDFTGLEIFSEAEGEEL